MLARLGAPFDSDQHLFEIKWDGIRALSFVEADAVRILTRNGNDVTGQYPELTSLTRLPAGTVVDGEIIALEEGMPSFEAVLRTRGGRSRGKPRPGTGYCIFDLLYLGYEPTMGLPLEQRRQPLAELVAMAGESNVIESTPVAGAGKALFAEASERQLEGVVAKRRDSVYQPGRRGDAWTKFKKRVYDHAVVLGYLPEEGSSATDGRFRSLVVAAHRDGKLSYAGRVGSGFDDALREQIGERLRSHPASGPLLPAPEQLPEVAWVEPRIYCLVSYVELTSAGVMRAPVFERLVEEDAR